MAGKKIHDNETKIHLIQCAKKEFMEKGFAGASLRGICQKAGVTTGALYFFFQDKDDLFCEVVGNFMDRLNEILREHFSFEVREMESGKAKEHDDSSDFEAVAQVVHELYTYRDEVLLVLTKAQGSSMERMPDRLSTRWMSTMHLSVKRCAKLTMCRWWNKALYTGCLIHRSICLYLW